MKYPTLAEHSPSKAVTSTFLGYNHNDVIKEGEFYEMQNFSSRYYPILSPRAKRGAYLSGTWTGTNGLISKDALCVVKGESVYINGYPHDLGLTSTPKQLISMGAYLIILPDKKYINTADTTDKGNIENSRAAASGASMYLCDIEGNAYTYTASSSAPTNPTDTQKWLDTSADPYVLKEYSSFDEMWVTIETTYVRINYTNIGSGFKAGDGIILSNIASPNTDLNGSNIIEVQNTNYIVVTGMINATSTSPFSSAVTVARTMPDMDFVIESGNRLWGCKYGIVGGKVVNEIYASALGDFKNWNIFKGISTDSYRASVGTDGQFTGAINFLGFPLFFKEEHLHKVYGNYPSNYQVQHTALKGVEKGSAKSLTIVNNILYYKGVDGIYAYDGSLPSKISYAFGDETYPAYHLESTDADYLTLNNKYYGNWIGSVGGTVDNKYYVCLPKKPSDPTTGHGSTVIMVWDTARKMWHKEDTTRVFGFCPNDGDLWYYNTAGIYSVLGTNKGGTALELTTMWDATSGIFGLETDNRKYISKINLKVSLASASRLFVNIQYDNGGWTQVAALEGEKALGTFNLVIKLRRCDHFRLKFYGYGDIKIYSMTKYLSQGSDV